MSKVGEYRENTKEALIKHAEGHIHKHAMNVEIFLKMPQELVNTRWNAFKKNLRLLLSMMTKLKCPKKYSQVYKKLDKNQIKYILLSIFYAETSRHNSEK